MGIAVGIDLGTTNSAVAVMRPNGYPEVLKNRDGKTTTSSSVLFQDFGSGDEPLVGEQAKYQAEQNPNDIVQYVKRYMGDPSWRFDSASGMQYTPEEVSAIILKRLKEDAELTLGVPVTDAVITVPAYFDDARRTATRHAGEIAGLNVLRVLNEPTAAALSYGVEAGHNGNVLVYDLGGGTFDVTILRIAGAEFNVVATDGDRNLGGFDFDNAFMIYLNQELIRQGAPNLFKDAIMLNQLREKAEQAKKALSTVAATNVVIPVGGDSYRVAVTREVFNEHTKSLLTRTEEVVQDTLVAAGMEWEDIDKVLLVGGSTRIPAVRQMFERISGKTPETGVNPDEAVALGAAIQAALAQEPDDAAVGFIGGRSAVEQQLGGGIEINDVTSQALGALLYEHGTDNLYNYVVIPRNSAVPGQYTDEIRTREKYQSKIRIQVTQGEDRDPDFVTRVGEGTLHMERIYPTTVPLRLIYKYDIDQTIEVEVIDLTADVSLGTFMIDRVANLKQDQVEQAAQRIGGMMIF